MSYFEAKALDGAVDQSGRFVWVDKRNQQATYQLQDSNGIPFLHHPMIYGAQPAPMPMVGPTNWCPMQPAPMPMACHTSWCPPPPPMAPFAGAGWFHPQFAGGTVAIVGKPLEEDKWVRWCHEESGNYYYHNKRKGETTWEKPEEFDKQENDGKPPPPETKKEEKKKGKYDSDRKGWL